MVECLGSRCQYYKQYYIPCSKDSPIPDLEAAAKGVVDRRCWHPNVFTPIGKVTKDFGVDIAILKNCPNTK